MSRTTSTIAPVVTATEPVAASEPDETLVGEIVMSQVPA